MNQKQIARLNVLAKKAKTEGLTASERQEQAALRSAYLQAVRKNLRAQLDQIRIVEADGVQHPLKRKQ